MPKLHGKTQTVKVVVRCRPANDKQKDHKLVVKVDEGSRMISVENPHPQKTHGPPIRDFTFDSTFGPNCKQQSVFEDTALPIIESVLEGYNGTIFAYGQTGTGKTHTMQGNQSSESTKGIVPRAIKYIFNAIQGAANTKKYLVRTSFLELYNQQLIDLLSHPDKKKQHQKDGKKHNLQIYQKPGQGIKVHNLSQFVIQSEKQMIHKYNSGKKHRVVAETQMNATSSRSHSIFAIIIQNQEQVQGKITTRAGKLNLVDLAGSQRQSKTGVSGVQREQAININLSLTTLGLVIQNLVSSRATHIPYRDSQLTRLLQDSLGGNTKTVMIANVGPSGYNYDQTLSTLKYANRAKNIKNDVRINQDPKDALLRQFQEEIKKLREQVAKNLGGGISGQGGVIQRIIEEEDVEGFQQKLLLEQEAMKKKFQQEKTQIYKRKNILEEEKSQLLRVIQQKEREQALYKQNQDALIKKIKKMEEKVLHGQEQEEAAMQKAETLKKKLQQVQHKRQKQRQIQQGLKIKEDQILTQKKEYNSLQQENQDKKLQIKQKIKRLKNLENENRQLQQMYSEQIQDLQERRRVLQKQLKLKNFIIDYFVPADYINMINEKVQWSQDHDDWFLPNLEISGNSLRYRNPEANYQAQEDQQLTQDMKDEMKLNELAKIQLQNHPNVYYKYSEEGLVRQLQPDLDGPKPAKKKKRPASKRKV